MAVEVGEIEVVRDGVDNERAGQIIGFLSDEGGLNEEAARRWLSEAVCAATDGGEIISVNSVRPAGLQLVGGRRFWIYDCVLAHDSVELWDRMFKTAFETLAKKFGRTGDGPVGVCALTDEQSDVGRRPEAVWPDTALMFAGYLGDGRQVRIRYFWDAAIGSGLPDSPTLEESGSSDYPLAEGYAIQPLAEGSGVSSEDVLAFWSREGAILEADEAGRRVSEVTLVGTSPDGAVAAVSSLYLQRNEQLRMDLWHYRTFVGREHRHGGFAAQLIFRNRDWIEERFVRGEDTRAPGMLFELENERMRKYFNRALWLPADFTFIGESELGAHVRVHYFPGAELPAAG